MFCSYEEFMRSKCRKIHSDKTVGKLKSRLISLPYSEPEFNNQFLRVMGSQKQRLMRFDSKENITSPLINYINGLRKTSFVQSHQVTGPKIRLFGGSTIDCQEVPDDYTIASQLQKLINCSPPHLSHFEVINYGISGATLSASFNEFNQFDIFKGDVCLFYFGANEGSFPKEFFKAKKQLSWIPALRQALDLFRKYQLISLYRIFEKIMTFDENHPLIIQKVNDVDTMLSSIASRCRSEGAQFVAILQPLLHTREPLSQFDVTNRWHNPKVRYKAQLFLFKRIVERLTTKSFFIDGRKIFNQTNLDVYIDWCHTNYLGNKIIADFFFSIIDQQMKD